MGKVLKSPIGENYFVLTLSYKKEKPFQTPCCISITWMKVFLAIVGRAGIEPATSCLSSMRSKPTELTPQFIFSRNNYPARPLNNLKTLIFCVQDIALMSAKIKKNLYRKLDFISICPCSVFINAKKRLKSFLFLREITYHCDAIHRKTPLFMQVLKDGAINI